MSDCDDDNQPYRDALALLTATDHQDDDARQLIYDSCCQGCLTDALLLIVLSLLDNRGSTVAEFAHELIGEVG